jgi:group I intron endonuclease
VELTRRLSSYYNIDSSKLNMRPIEAALNKYGLDSFTLEILEYCKKDEVTDREQHYLDLDLPEYNILKKAYNSLGFKHTEETIANFKETRTAPEYREFISSIHKDKVVSEETKSKLSAALKSYKLANPLTKEGLENITNKTIAREGIEVNVLNTKTNEITSFSNQTEAAGFLGITRQGIYAAVKRGSLVKDIYKITKK